jgi:hypothetical protein
MLTINIHFAFGINATTGSFSTTLISLMNRCQDLIASTSSLHVDALHCKKLRSLSKSIPNVKAPPISAGRDVKGLVFGGTPFRVKGLQPMMK